MTDIFDEVEKDLRQEKLEKAWKKYGAAFISVAVIAVLATAGWLWWRNAEREQAQAEGARYGRAIATAYAENDIADGIEQLRQLAADSDGGYAILARLRAAALLRDEGDVGGAVAQYETLASDESVDSLYRDLATVLVVMNSLTSGDNQALRERLDPLTGPDRAFRYAALELQAILNQAQGFRAQAQDLYRTLSDAPEAPAPLRARAAEMLAAFGPLGPGGLAPE